MASKGILVALTLASLASFSLRAEEAADATWKKVDGVFGATGKDLPGGVHRFGWPRRDLHLRVGEVAVAPALALGSWGAFVKAGEDGRAMTMGDLVLLETELTPVVSALQAGGTEISAIHTHLVNQSPHVIYVRF